MNEDKQRALSSVCAGPIPNLPIVGEFIGTSEASREKLWRDTSNFE